MRYERSIAIGLAVLMGLAQAAFAQRGRGGGPGVGGAGRAAAPAAPKVTRESSGTSGSPAGVGRGAGASSMKRLENDSALARRVQPMLPPGSDLNSAAAGFHNEHEFVAALEASRNLGIPFDQLKNQMTEGKGKSLGAAIHTLRPDLDSKSVNENVKAAGRMANEEMRSAKEGRVDSAATVEVRSNPRLSARLTPLLPEGMTFDQASSGFRNTGQFVAALHVAKNLNIPFSELRARMIAGGESLGEAIHMLRPEMPAAEIEAGVSGATRTAQGDLEAGRTASASGPVRQ